MTRVAIYARVSTDDQTVENQIAELRAAAERRGWDCITVFADEGISGTKGREKRPAFDQLLKGATRRDFDIVASWSVDRLGRSLQDLVSFLGDIRAAGVDLYLHKQGLDTSTAAGRMLFQILGVFAEFEAAIIKERVRSGIARARRTGTRSGKAIGRPALTGKKKAAVEAALGGGASVREAARRAGVSHGSAGKVKAGLSAPSRT